MSLVNSVDYIDGCVGSKFSVLIIRNFTIKLGYSSEVEIEYKNRVVQSQIGSTNAVGLRDNKEIDVNYTFNEVNEHGDKILYGSESEELYNSDYEFHYEDDDLIYGKYGNVVDVDENGDIVLNSKVGLEMNGTGNSGGQCYRTRVTSEKNQSRGLDDDDDTDLHIYDGKNITVVDESNCMISEEILSL
ncbi:hypothetical protein ACH5RR_032735 [Cinchona calisaya]|uniref:Uncharacterized protein n=1 Tax=Cinchona calisaya TaxID=153742 RepID=A0ABD2YK36_9GENT